MSDLLDKHFIYTVGHKFFYKGKRCQVVFSIDRCDGCVFNSFHECKMTQYQCFEFGIMAKEIKEC